MGELSQGRAAAVAGVVFVVCAAAAAFSAGSPPGVDASSADINSFFVAHHKVLLVGAVLSSVAAPCLVWLIAGLAGALRRAGEGALAAVTFGVGVGAAVLATAADATWAAMTQLAWVEEPTFLKSGYDVSGFLVQKAFWFAAFTALAASLAVRRTEALPRWYEWTCVGAGAVFALGGIAMKPDGFFAVGGGMALIAFVAFLGWALATCLLLWQEDVPVEAVAAATTSG